MAGQTFALEVLFGLCHLRIFGRGTGFHIVVLHVHRRFGRQRGNQADSALRRVSKVVVDHDVGAVLGDHHFHDRAVARTQQHRLHAQHLVGRVAFDPDLVKNCPDHMKARGFARPHVQHKQAHPLARLGLQRLFHHAVVDAVEHRVIGLRRAQALGVEHIQRRATHLAPRGVGLDVKLTLHHQVLAVRLGRVALARLDDERAVHARCDVLQNHRRTAVVHEDAGVVELEIELNRLPRGDGAVLVLRRHHGGMEVHGMHHGRGHHHQAAGHGLVAAVGHAEVNRVPHPRADGGAGHLVAKSPGAELHARCELNDFVGGIELHPLDRAGVQQLELGHQVQRSALRKRARIPHGAHDRGRRTQFDHMGIGGSRLRMGQRMTQRYAKNGAGNYSYKNMRASHGLIL